jgi:endogenous inhibitor of DNA gyrase (YacG/DUF329 family)
MPRCPVCSGPVDLVKTPTAPFCSERCQTVDLGRWLGEAYGLPEPPRDDEEDGGEPPHAPGDEA